MVLIIKVTVSMLLSRQITNFSMQFFSMMVLPTKGQLLASTKRKAELVEFSPIPVLFYSLTTTTQPSEYPRIARFSSKCVFHQITAVGYGHEEIVDSVEVSIAADDKLSGLLSQGVDEVLDTTFSVPSPVESLWNDEEVEMVAEFGF
jgi:hypothetical protein